ncbi:translation initiation factor eaIF-5B [Staphylothermus marinus F1]|uniref:Probable translation initiation factor IF-2 n=1 Tax=Staphylothermus marinus (strain ATCC 43588 / DSM 3639 / JCM 9404 / F1) TaxID=399550 RepID=IF2P_STAMF|nr:translation initiation factor IF-2 [Staphylothermus marinus]A3DMS0.1 RecName: Full=Probable translation initiation factor IF-2 [Staphylothermus marinus F1]ABN69930.1 translation initiation factor eaIF-5B [Staphylothermus marinus F1]
MSSVKSGKSWIRQPIVVVLGHVDHGKTTLLDKIRGTAVAKKEPGEITQHVGASIVPASVLRKVAEPLKKYFPKLKIEIPGLLFVDTPGHELFSNLRRRGGSVADIAILVVDIMEGFQPQTWESIQILKERKVPFIVAANKIDRIPGWKPNHDQPFLETIRKQDPRIVSRLEELIYRLISQLYEAGFMAERFDRVKDFRTTVAIVPVSAKTGEGVPELLALLTGLVQRFMKKRLVTSEEPAKGVVLEVKEEPGLGTTIDVIIYDGVIRRGDTIVVGGKDKPIVTKVRALLMPRPLQDMRAHEGKFVSVEQVVAATGVKISAPDLDNALAGSPIFVVPSEDKIEEYIKIVKEEIESVRIKTDNIGVVVKADTLGTLEAVVEALKRENIPVRLADVGPVSKNDVLEASVSKNHRPEYGVIIAFNVKILPEAEEYAARENVKIFRHNVIYKLIEDYIGWVKQLREQEKIKELESLIRPGKIRILPGYIFRRSNPAIVGVEVIGGVIKPGYPLMRKDGMRLGTIMQIRDRDNVLKEARAGQSVAISIRGRILVGRHVDEGDILYTDIPKQHVHLWLTKYKNELSDDEKMVLKEIIEIKKKQDPFYGLVFGS